MIRLIKLLTLVVTIICTGLVLYKLFTEDSEKRLNGFVLESGKPIFEMEVGHDKWHGKLEPGRYTKSGILIIKQQDNGN
jgi:hypothetical protein